MTYLLRKTANFLVFFFLLVGVAYADNVCDAILKYGIFDKSNTLDQTAKYEMVKNAHCNSSAKDSSTSAGLGYDELFIDVKDSRYESKKFCSSNSNELSSSRYYWNIVSKASPVIANAWKECIGKVEHGTIHYIEPVQSEPAIFTYKILYAATGKPHETKIKTWNMSGVKSCKEELPKKGDLIDSGGYEIQCKRNPEDVVVITANTESGNKYTKRVILPAHRVIAPPPPKIVQGDTQNMCIGEFKRKCGSHTIFRHCKPWKQKQTEAMQDFCRQSLGRGSVPVIVDNGKSTLRSGNMCGYKNIRFYCEKKE